MFILDWGNGSDDSSQSGTDEALGCFKSCIKITGVVWLLGRATSTTNSSPSASVGKPEGLQFRGYVAMAALKSKKQMANLISEDYREHCEWSPMTAHQIPGVASGKAPSQEQIESFLMGGASAATLVCGPWNHGKFGGGGRPTNNGHESESGGSENTIKIKPRQAIEMVEEGWQIDEFKQADPDFYWANKGKLKDEIAEHNQRKRKEDQMKSAMSHGELNDWQQKVVDMVEQQEASRRIYWCFDQEGCRGKSELVKYLSVHYDAYVTGPGRSRDIAHGYDEVTHSNIVIFNFTRAQSRGVHYKDCYSTMENFLDGEIFSTKYNSKPKEFPKCHVLVFSNNPPQIAPEDDIFTRDRLQLVDLGGEPSHFK